MPVIQIDWKIIRRESEYADSISKLKYTNGWTVECIWSESLEGTKPKSIIIRRKNDDAVGDLEIAGNLILFVNGIQILKKKFMDLMESGSTYIKINLKKDTQPCLTYYGFIILEVKGRVDISPYSEIPDNLMSSLLGLSSDFEQLLNPETSRIPPDVNLKCDNGSVQAHKFILSARSPVFAAMFASPMKESVENEVVITDIEVFTMHSLVRYLYMGWSGIEMITVSLACELLFAADKYQVLPLKADCCKFLEKNISQKNALLLLCRGDMYAEALKSIAMRYICQCPDFSTIQNSLNWKNLETKKPVLAMEVLSSLIKSRDNKIKRFRPY